jgi:hypothetical protein
VEILKQWPRSDDGYINRRSEAQKHLQTLRSDLDDSASEKAVVRYRCQYHMYDFKIDKLLGSKNGTGPSQKLAKTEQKQPKTCPGQRYSSR